MNKAHLAMTGSLQKGAYPRKADRKKLLLSVGERRRASDAFALVPFLSDPATMGYLKQVVDYVASGMVGYQVEDVIRRLKGEKDENKQAFIGSIYAEVVNIVNRVDASGGIDRIDIGSPTNGIALIASFDERKKTYINGLKDEYYLGDVQTIEGTVYRLYPNSLLVTIRRSGARKVDVHLSEQDFNRIRYSKESKLKVRAEGRPRFKLGEGSRAISEFEADSIEILPTS